MDVLFFFFSHRKQSGAAKKPGWRDEKEKSKWRERSKGEGERDGGRVELHYITKRENFSWKFLLVFVMHVLAVLAYKSGFSEHRSQSLCNQHKSIN